MSGRDCDFKVPFNDPLREFELFRSELESSFQRVMGGGWLILGPEVRAFEEEFSQYCGTSHCVSVNSGTDALEIALRAVGVQAGDCVGMVANAGCYASAAVDAVGGTPVYFEVGEQGFLLDVGGLTPASLRSIKALIVTHLYGSAADMPGIMEATRARGIPVIEDCAQAHGAICSGRRAGAWGDVGCFSFFPTKNLGALGDAGAVVTTNDLMAEKLRELRQYGWVSKYKVAIHGGRNSRMDEVQASFLRVKLRHLNDLNARRKEIAERYNSAFELLPIELNSMRRDGDAWHLYVIESSNRNGLKGYLNENGVQSDVHYPIPDHRQPVRKEAFAELSLRRTERLADEVLSLPCFPTLKLEEQQRVIDVVHEYFARL